MCASITFETVAKGAYAGFWMRASSDARIWVVLRSSGEVDAHLERKVDDQTTLTALGTAARVDASVGHANVLRARLAGDVLTLFVNGMPSGAMLCPKDFYGTFELFARTADDRASSVLFEAPSAKLMSR
jgi:hypothetical protein